MPVVFNSISQFVDAVGLRKDRKKRDELDSIDRILTGPSAIADTFAPALGTPHPNYPLMTSLGYAIQNKEALVAEMHVPYVGKLSGSSPYFSAPTITPSRHEGSISWTTYLRQVVKILTPAIGVDEQQFGPGFTGGTFSTPATVQATYSVGYQSVSYLMRYTSQAVTFRYLTNVRPAGNFAGLFANAATPYLGVTNKTQYATGCSTANDRVGLVTAEPSFQNILTNLGVEDQANSWFPVTETYETRAFINSTVILSA